MHVMNDSPRPRPLAGAIGALILIAILLAPAAPAAGQCAVQQFSHQNPDEYDYFGIALTTCDGVALVGASKADEYAEDMGAVFLYEFDGVQWVAQGALPAPSVLDVTAFGVALDMRDDLAIVGAQDDRKIDWRICAFVYRFDGESWQEEASLSAPVGVASHPSMIAINPGFACVGSRLWGRAYIYRFDADAVEWVYEGWIEPDDGHEGDEFGMSVAFAGDLLLVGAPGHDLNGEWSGAAYAFRYDPDRGAWIQDTKFLPGGLDADDRFGWTIAATDDRVVIGAVRADPDGLETGSAYVYRREAEQWVEEALLTASDGGHLDLFGASCSTENDLIVVGANGADGLEEGVGGLFVFTHDGTCWTETGKFVNAVGSAWSGMGNQVAIGGEGALAAVWRADDPVEDCGAVLSVAIPGEDCNRNNMCDWLDLAEGVSEDCNLNEIPDECDAAVEFIAESGELSPIGHGSPQMYTITAPPPAFDGDVGLRFYVSADLGYDGQYIELHINDYAFGTVFEHHVWPCSDPPDQTQIRIPQVVYNYMIKGGEDLVIEMTASEPVNAEACDGESYIAVEVFCYTYGPGDENHNGIPDECECPADFDGDGDVDTADLLFLLGAWGTPDGDVDFDGDTDTADLLLLLGAWGECPEEKAERGKAES